MEQKPIIQRLVVKIGGSVLTDEEGRFLPGRLSTFAAQVAVCTASHREVLVVSSGAIPCGMARLGLKRRPRDLAQLQACAAIGQGELMRLYGGAFAAHRLLTAQVLLTQEDLADRVRHGNAKRTLLTLLGRHAIPIINENDTVAVEEITFGDNDRLAALVASTVGAQLLVLLTDVEGLLHDGRLIERIDATNHATHQPLRGRVRRHTTKGGMASKLAAARIAGHDGIPTVIANGLRPLVLADLLEGKPVGTLCVPSNTRLSRRKWRIAFALRRPRGEVVVDEGAAAALLERGKSLLASGIIEIRGRFEAGDLILVVDAGQREVARGVANFSSTELLRVRGLQSAEVARVLGQDRAREVIHRDHLVLAREVHP